MKTKIILFFLIVFTTFSVISQNACATYYPFREGAKFQMTTYDKKGEKESVMDYEIVNLKNNVATVNTKISDENDEEITTASYEITCKSDAISIDFKSLMNSEMLEQYKDMEIDMTGTNIELPNNLSIGQTLKDALLNLAINMGGIKMNISINLINRKVNAKESITTSAGTFNCYALSYNSEIKMGIKQSFVIKEWVAEGVGVVKSETYNKSGKLLEYTELTSITK